MFKLFDPSSECFAKYQYDAFCFHIFDYACLRQGLLLSKRFETMEQLYTSKTFLKMAGGRMYTPHPTPLAISYRNHEKSVAYFSPLALLVFFY